MSINVYEMEKVLNVLKMEYVTIDDYGNTIPLADGFRNCIPVPSVVANVTSSSLNNGVVTLGISGTVTDDTSNVVVDPADQVQELYVTVEGEVVSTIALTNNAQPELPWKPYRFSANYSTTVSFAVEGPSSYPVVLETSPNAAGNCGRASVTATVGTGTNSEREYSAMLDLFLDAAHPDQVVFYLGDRAPVVGDAVLTATGTPNEYQGSFVWTDVKVFVSDFAGLTGGVDTLTALVTFLSPDGRETAVEVPMTETDATSGRFTYAHVRIISGGTRALIGMDYLSNTVNLVLDPAQPETVTFGVGENPLALYDEATLTETPTGSSIFVGDAQYASVRAEIEAFGGLTGGIDTMTVLFEFSYSDGSKETRQLTLTETGTETRRLAHRELPPLATWLTLDSVEGDSGSDPGTFLPVMLRIQGIDEYSSLQGLTVEAFGSTFEIAPFTFPGQDKCYYPIDENEKAVVFVPAATAESAVNVAPVVGILTAVLGGCRTAKRTETPGIYVGNLWVETEQPVDDPWAETRQPVSDAAANKTADDIIAHIWKKAADWKKMTIAKETLRKMLMDRVMRYDFTSWDELKLELELRQATADAAVAFEAAPILFGGTPNLQFNRRYWTIPWRNKHRDVLNKHKHMITDEIYQQGVETAINDVYATKSGRDRYRMECSMAVTAVWLKAAVDVCRARSLVPDSVLCRSWKDAAGKWQCNLVAITDKPRWEIGNPQKQVYNRGMRIALWNRTTLLPGDWFGVQGEQENWLYVGNDRYFGHGARQCVGVSGDTGPMNEVKELGSLMPGKNFIDAAHFLQEMQRK